jgi:CP family cyanate transporter-like MFS transporter
VSAADAGLHQGLLQVVGIGASLVAGSLLHRLRMDARPAVIAFAVPSLLGLAGQMLWPDAAVAWAVLLGLGIGGTFVVSISLLSLRTVHPAQTAQLSAMSQAVGYAFAASGPIIFGGLADVTGSWGPPLAVLLWQQLAQLAFGLLAARPGTLQERLSS